MVLPAELGRDQTERLRAPQADTGAIRPPPAAAPDPPPGRRARVVALAKRTVRNVLGPSATARLRVALERAFGNEALRRSEDSLRNSEASLRRVAELEGQVTSLQRRFLGEELAQQELHAATVNLELLKGEVRSVVQALEDLGMAIAPATGLAGAGVRLSELRERVNGLDRRLRGLAAATGPAPDRPPGHAGAGGGGGPGAPAGAPVPVSALFDYVGFERRFRGDPELLAAELASRYLELLAAHPPVLDIGCGRAELLQLLAGRGVEAIGVDTDPSMVAEARDRGLDVRLVDGTSFLRSAASGSIGAIVATHLVEHLEFADLVELLELAVSRLRPGGLLVAETPNPASLIVLGNSFILDPTHLRPLHPSLLTFLCEGAGFRDVRLRFYAPASDYHLPAIGDPEAPPWVRQVNEAFAKLNAVLFGPQEYAVIATAPDGPGRRKAPDR
jgi:SAM-dependent methyltransferase